MISRQKYCLQCHSCGNKYVLKLKEHIIEHSLKVDCRCGTSIKHTIPKEAIRTSNKIIFGFNPFDCRMQYRDSEGNDEQVRISESSYLNLDEDNSLKLSGKETNESVAFIRIQWIEREQRLKFELKPIKLGNRVYINSVDSFLPLYLFRTLEDRTFIGTQSGFQAIIKILQPLHIQN